MVLRAQKQLVARALFEDTSPDGPKIILHHYCQMVKEKMVDNVVQAFVDSTQQEPTQSLVKEKDKSDKYYTQLLEE
jgi:hypothetical protein